MHPVCRSRWTNSKNAEGLARVNESTRNSLGTRACHRQVHRRHANPEYSAGFIDAYRDAIAQRVVESYPPRYRPSEPGRELPPLLRAPLGAQADAIRGAALSLEAQRGTTVVGEMGTGKTFIAASAAHMAGFERVLVLCPPHLTRKWKREVEETVPGARAVIVASITDLERQGWRGWGHRGSRRGGRARRGRRRR